jgi:hypothetical protein
MPIPRRILVWALGLCTMFGFLPRAQAQAALLMEEPYGFFGTLNPTGHNALYFARICAETPVKLRRCEPGELGSVIARYQGIAGYDWVAIPLIPYLYSVEQTSDVPIHVDRATVTALRDRYHEQHLGVLGAKVFEGSFTHGGWNQLIGVSYERRIYAFRFDTTVEQDDDLIAEMNDSKNKSEFNLTYNNCADFARKLLNQYFPGTFKRSIFPDAGMTTPRQIAYKLVKYSKKHPESDLVVYEIPQVPGYRHMSHSNKSVSASLVTTAYAVPIVVLNPYLAGGIFVDYLVRGRYPVLQGHPVALTPDQLSVLASFPKVPSAPTMQPPVPSLVASDPPSAPVRQTLAPATAVALKVNTGTHE